LLVAPCSGEREETITDFNLKNDDARNVPERRGNDLQEAGVTIDDTR
jgi:hypothetical protein